MLSGWGAFSRCVILAASVLWSGLAVGRLYLATEDGKLLCFEGK